MLPSLLSQRDAEASFFSFSFRSLLLLFLRDFLRLGTPFVCSFARFFSCYTCTVRTRIDRPTVLAFFARKKIGGKKARHPSLSGGKAQNRTDRHTYTHTRITLPLRKEGREGGREAVAPRDSEMGEEEEEEEGRRRPIWPTVGRFAPLPAQNPKKPQSGRH